MIFSWPLYKHRYIVREMLLSLDILLEICCFLIDILLEICCYLSKLAAALPELKPIWRDNNISLGSKVKLMRFLVISIFCMPVNHGP